MITMDKRPTTDAILMAHRTIKRLIWWMRGKTGEVRPESYEQSAKVINNRAKSYEQCPLNVSQNATCRGVGKCDKKVLRGQKSQSTKAYDLTSKKVVTPL